MSQLRRAYGLGRSLLIYHGIPGRQRRLRRLYRQFVRPGSLTFDIGAHVGNRTRALRAIGCRVVAVEPQPDCARLLRAYFDDSGRRQHRRKVAAHPSAGHVAVLEAAVAAAPGEVTLAISERHPTLSTHAAAWRAAREADPVFAGIQWNASTSVEAITLDRLIARFGLPAFVKIDVEGSESDVLAGLSQPIPALSFEYLPTAPREVGACLQRLGALGPYRYNWSRGESYSLGTSAWLSAAGLLQALATGEATRQSGDVYAVLE